MKLTHLIPVLLGLLACTSSPLAEPEAAVDPSHPASMAGIYEIRSHGSLLNAIVYEAAGAGPHPTVVLLHGLPGEERNLDLAHAIRRAGWNVIFFHYRGAWGSRGEFSFSNVLEDVATVVAATEPLAGAHRIDPERIALVGHSMGGFAALVSASELDAVDCVVSIAGANFGAMAGSVPGTAEARGAMAERFSAMTAGPIPSADGADMLEEIVTQAERFDTTRHAPALARKPALLVAGTRDNVTALALHHEPLVAAVRAQGAGDRLESLVLPADHAFSDQRLELASTVVKFLNGSCLPALR